MLTGAFSAVHAASRPVLADKFSPAHVASLVWSLTSLEFPAVTPLPSSIIVRRIGTCLVVLFLQIYRASFGAHEGTYSVSRNVEIEWATVSSQIL